MNYVGPRYLNQWAVSQADMFGCMRKKTEHHQFDTSGYNNSWDPSNAEYRVTHYDRIEEHGNQVPTTQIDVNRRRSWTEYELRQYSEQRFKRQRIGQAEHSHFHDQENRYGQQNWIDSSPRAEIVWSGNLDAPTNFDVGSQQFSRTEFIGQLTNWHALQYWKDINQLPTLGNLAGLFQLTQKDKNSVSDDLLQWLSEHFIEIINTTPEREKSAKNYSIQLGKILCGCQQFSTTNSKNPDKGLNNFLTMVAEFIHRRLFAENKLLDEKTIGNAVYGLKNLTKSEGTEAIFWAMAMHLNSQQNCSGKALCKALYGLQKMTSSPGTEALIFVIAGHIGNEKFEQLTPEMVALALYGLQNMTPSMSTEALLSAISAHIASMEGQQIFSHQQVAIGMFGLRKMALDLGVNRVLWGLAEQIQRIELREFTAQEIAMTIGGMQNMSSNDCTERLFKSIEGHIKDSQQWNLNSLRGAVSGLRGKQNSPSALKIISALAEKIATMESIQLHDKEKIDLFIADILNSANEYFGPDAPDERKRALWFVATLLERFYPKRFPLIKLCYLTTLDDIIFEVISPKLIKGNNCDLHGCSYELAAMIVRYSLDQFLNKQAQNNAQKMVIVFGSGSHMLQNAGRMKAVVEDVIHTRLSSSSNFHIRWEGPYVVIQGNIG